MSVDTATPTGSAASVGDRYRLIECVAGDPDGPAAAWRAWDNLLNRPVTLTIVRPGGPAAGGFLGHAHAVSTVVHPALARVYDAVDEGDRAYVVSEWVSGTPLTALLNDGALDAESAAGTVARVADGVAAAHAAGVAFGGVHPDHVVVTADGGVKLAQVVGDGRAGTGDDLRGLGALLYGALTAHWPLAATGGAAALRPATTSSGHLLSPRQVRAGVPEDLSTLAVRALDQGSPQGLRSAAAMAAVLTERAGPAEDDFAFPPDDRGKRRRPRWLGVAIPVVAGLSALAMIGWLVGTALGGLPGADGGGADRGQAGGGRAARPRRRRSGSPRRGAVLGRRAGHVVADGPVQAQAGLRRPQDGHGHRVRLRRAGHPEAGDDRHRPARRDGRDPGGRQRGGDDRGRAEHGAGPDLDDPDQGQHAEPLLHRLDDRADPGRRGTVPGIALRGHVPALTGSNGIVATILGA